MKKYIIVLAALAAAVSCRSLIEEWQPVLSDKYDAPAEKAYDPTGITFTTIADLKAMYAAPGVEILDNIWIKGQVISSDKTGNVYRELYIQDATGGIDVKVGKSSLYSDYMLGQWIYVNCNGLTLGAYNGMPQLGMEPDQTSSNEYETSYIDVQAIIDNHVFKGEKDTPLAPKVVTEADIKASISAGFKGELWGQLVTVKGMTYGKEIFALLYPNSNMAHKSGNPENRVFLSKPTSGAVAGKDYTWGIQTWSLSKQGFIDLLNAGNLDDAEVGSGNSRYGNILGTPAKYLSEATADLFGADKELTYKEIMIKYATANYVSHYFKTGSTNVQVRTSGYAKFADEKLDSDIISAASKVDITGILSIYDGSAQFTLVDEPSVSVVKSN